MMHTLFPAGDGIFQDDNAPTHAAELVQSGIAHAFLNQNEKDNRNCRGMLWQKHSRQSLLFWVVGMECFFFLTKEAKSSVPDQFDV
ncbi:hypothetical protein TNCV_2375231 [Trichonephila clavipes]|nr:hypothetical protein TNCV_2375231 [Trichonephila clavipes]